MLDVPGTGQHVQGEIYHVDDQMLGFLDEFEDAPRYYKRKLEAVNIIAEPALPWLIKDVVGCWCYKMDNFKDDLLAKEHLVSYSTKNNPGYSEP